ncbi:MAG: hypothetical protein QOJ89_2708 [bacterium]|jgi:hypothetical protein
MRRLILVGALAIVGIAATPAAATAPMRGSFDHSNSFVDDEVCAAAPWGFDVSATEHEYGTFHIFVDGAGEFVKAIVHNNYDATISANGKTIVERDTWQITVYADGTSRFTGSSVHIQGPGGIVVRDAGQVVFDADGNVSYSRGPHEQLVDDVSFCPALAS